MEFGKNDSQARISFLTNIINLSSSPIPYLTVFKILPTLWPYLAPAISNLLANSLPKPWADPVMMAIWSLFGIKVIVSKTKKLLVNKKHDTIELPMGYQYWRKNMNFELYCISNCYFIFTNIILVAFLLPTSYKTKRVNSNKSIQIYRLRCKRWWM